MVKKSTKLKSITNYKQDKLRKTHTTGQIIIKLLKDRILSSKRQATYQVQRILSKIFLIRDHGSQKAVR